MSRGSAAFLCFPQQHCPLQRQTARYPSVLPCSLPLSLSVQLMPEYPGIRVRGVVKRVQSRKATGLHLRHAACPNLSVLVAMYVTQLGARASFAAPPPWQAGAPLARHESGF